MRKERVPGVTECSDDVDRWAICYKKTWDRSEHNNVSELRTIVAAVRHAGRSRPNWGKMILVITDSLVSLGATAQGWSSSCPLYRRMWRMAATVLGLCLKIYPRFIGTLRNVADGPSRGFGVGHAPAWVKEKERRILQATIKSKMKKKVNQLR